MRYHVIWTSVLVLATLTAPGTPLLSPAAAQTDKTNNQLLAEAVKQLTVEAIELGKFKDIQIQPHFERPHPALGGFGGEMALDILDRMLEPFAGNVYEDTYIRWHMLHVVKLASAQDRRKMGKRLVRLVKQMPGPLDRPYRREWRFEPEDLGNQFLSLRNSLIVIVGYPPYEKQYFPPESFQYMDPARRADAEEVWQKVQEIRSRIERIDDRDAVAYNSRTSKVNWVVRQYRGELIYTLFFTGDPQMARLLMSTVSAHARKKSGVGVDLISFWYLAVFDGALDLYKQDLLDELSRKLEQTARASEAWYTYNFRQRNFADYAFHLVEMLKDGGGFTRRGQPLPGETAATEGDGA
jgi:hypothetical protein